jgi:hypothetical protein
MNSRKLTHFVATYYVELLSALLLVLIVWSFRFNGLYGQDAHEYLRISRDLKSVFFHGTQMQHSIFPVLYPLSGFLVSEFLRNDFLGMQLVSIIAFVLAFHFVKRLLQILYGKNKFISIYLVLFFCLSPYILRFALLSMSDMLCTFLVTAATYYTVKFYRDKEDKTGVLSILFSSCAMATRYACLVIIFPLLIFTVWNLIKKKSSLTFLICLVAGIIPLLPDILLRNRLLFFQLTDGHVRIDYGSNAYSWSLLNFFRRDFLNADGWQHYSQWNIMYVIFNLVHPAFLFAGILLLIFVRKRDFISPVSQLLLSIILLYAGYLAGLQYQSLRYLLLTFPFILVLMFPAFLRVVNLLYFRRIVSGIIVSIVIILQVCLFIYSSKTIYKLNQSEQAIAEGLLAFPSKIIYTCSINGALQSYGIENKIIDLYSERIDGVSFPSLLLFNEKDFPEHFKGKNPMLNLEFLQSHYTLHLLQSFNEGWNLYQIEQQ